jgi:hypothetical protein
MSETKQIVGQCHEVSEKNGWTTFAVSIVGKQYPVKLSTKKDEIVAAARAVGTQVATWTFTETESDQTNPHTGSPYVNRYLNTVVAGASPAAGEPAPTQPRSSSEAAHEPMLNGDKDRVITRLAVLKAAAQLYSGTGNIEGVIGAASRLETWVMRDIDPIPFDRGAAQPQNTPQNALNGPESDDQPPYDDEPPEPAPAALSATQQAAVDRALGSGVDDGIPF